MSIDNRKKIYLTNKNYEFLLKNNLNNSKDFNSLIEIGKTLSQHREINFLIKDVEEYYLILKKYYLNILENFSLEINSSSVEEIKINKEIKKRINRKNFVFKNSKTLNLKMKEKLMVEDLKEIKNCLTLIEKININKKKLEGNNGN